ncbi:hypothetical protein [Streptomyces flaveolus]
MPPVSTEIPASEPSSASPGGEAGALSSVTGGRAVDGLAVI